MLEAVITIEVHARDVLVKLIEENVININDFDWISQLRYYWVDDKDLKVRAVNAEFSYGYVAHVWNLVGMIDPLIRYIDIL